MKTNWEKHVITCPACGKEALDHMENCPHCGAQLKQALDPEKLKRFKQIANIVGFALAGVIIIAILIKKLSLG